MDFSQRIKNIRESKGLSQTEVANRMETERSNYHRLENRGEKLTFEQISQIAKALEVSTAELIGIDTTDTINGADKIVNLLKENEELKEKMEYLSSQIKDWKFRASKFDVIEQYYSDYFNSHLEDYKDALLIINFLGEDYNWVDLIKDEREKFNIKTFFIFSEQRDFYRIAIEEFSALSNPQIIYAWRRFNYLYPYSFTVQDVGVDVWGNLNLMKTFIEERANNGKYRYHPKEVAFAQYTFLEYEKNK